MQFDFSKKLLMTLAFIGVTATAQAQTANCAADIKQVETALANQKDAGVKRMVDAMLRDANDELNQEKDEAACREIMAEAKKVLNLK